MRAPTIERSGRPSDPDNLVQVNQSIAPAEAR
jgi:hypothetical protein